MKKTVGFIFAAGIILMFLLVIIGAGSDMIERYSIETYQWDALVYYPFNMEEDISENAEDSFGNSISKKIFRLKTKVENRVSSTFCFRIPFILVKKSCDKALGLDMTASLCAGENDLTKSTDVVMAYQDDWLGFPMDDADISESIENLLDFGIQMKQEGRNFLFFMNPEKFTGNEIYMDYSKEKENEIVSTLEAGGLDVLSIPQLIEQEGIDTASLFFKTDHHWLPSSGIWADGILCETLNKRYGYSFEISVFDMKNYDTSVMENAFLGSLGKKVTEIYCDKEDFPVVIPRYNTNLEVFISGKDETVSGSIEDTLLDFSVFDKKNIYMKDRYHFYGYGDQALITIHNTDIHDGSHILMIKTSFADCMYPYLSAVVEDLDVIDLRKFDGSLQSYIAQTDPDTVIIVYGATMFGDADSRVFDFR